MLLATNAGMAATLADELRAIARRVRHEHRALERVLDRLHTGAVRLRDGAVPQRRIEDQIYELWTKVEDHALAEERLLLPLVPQLDTDDAARVQLMLHEHDLQRRLLLATLDLTEPGMLSLEELATVSMRLVRTLRADIELEEELFVDLGNERGQTSTSAR